MRAYILLDRSGSMAGQWSDTLGAINGYVKGLPQDTPVYLAAFSSGYFYGDGFNENTDYQVLRNEPAATFVPLSPTETSPNGGTPLLDSMARLLDEAFSENPERAYIIVMTDGEENSSRHNTKKVIQEKLARAEDRNWEVVFLGANFDNVHDQSRSVGLSYGKSLNISTANYASELNNLSASATAYASAGTRTVFTDEDQKRAQKK